MRNIKLTIEYDGKDFNGWQKQPNKLNIQGTIEQAIKSITCEDVELNASGRTDAGVHALGQVANFKTNSQIPIEKFAIAINSRLKKSIVIKKAEEVDERFHSRLNCKRKTYRYIINNSPYGTAIYRYLETHIPQKLNVEKMKKAVFFDADGTLCDMEKGVPQSTKEALKKLRENGHDAWLCTGRSRAFVSWYLEELPFTGMISACGATIEKDGERLFNKEMPPEVAKKSVEILRRYGLVPVMEGADFMYYDKDEYNTDVNWYTDLITESLGPKWRPIREMKIVCALIRLVQR